jgi:hypothetical protein
LKNAREVMDVIAAYQQVGSYRGAAQICGTTHRTVKRIVDAQLAGGQLPGTASRVHNYDGVAELVARRVKETSGPDLSETVAAARPCRRLWRIGAKLPSPGRSAESVMAHRSSSGSSAGGVVAG